MEHDYDPDKWDLYEEWIDDWQKDNKVKELDKDTEDILVKFFDKIVYPNYFYGNSNCADWTLEEIKDNLLKWYLENHGKLENQFGNLIREVQRRNLKDKCEETETLKNSRFLYTKQTGSCI